MEPRSTLFPSAHWTSVALCISVLPFRMNEVRASTFRALQRVGEWTRTSIIWMFPYVHCRASFTVHMRPLCNLCTLSERLCHDHLFLTISSSTCVAFLSFPLLPQSLLRLHEFADTYGHPFEQRRIIFPAGIRFLATPNPPHQSLPSTSHLPGLPLLDLLVPTCQIDILLPPRCPSFHLLSVRIPNTVDTSTHTAIIGLSRSFQASW